MVELILKNTLSKDDVVVLIEPVVELILKLTKSCEPVWVFRDCVAKLTEAVNIEIVFVCWINDAVNWFNSELPNGSPAKNKVSLICTEPVNSCLSVDWSPIILEPVTNNTDDVIYSV